MQSETIWKFMIYINACDCPWSAPLTIPIDFSSILIIYLYPMPVKWIRLLKEQAGSLHESHIMATWAPLWTLEDLASLPYKQGVSSFLIIVCGVGQVVISAIWTAHQQLSPLYGKIHIMQKIVWSQGITFCLYHHVAFSALLLW